MRTGRNSQRGYALIIMIVLLAMGLLYGVVSQLSLVGAKVTRTQGTSAALLQAKEALIGYAATYRDTHAGEVFGYLPCPDADGDGDADTANTSRSCGSATQAVVGLLPYRTLGLSDLRDANGECLWYAVSGSYKASLTKPEPMNWDTRGHIRILDSNGVTMLADPVNGTEGGAVAVIFAAGPPLSANVTGRGSNSGNTCGNNGKANWTAFLESVVSDLSGLTGFDSSGNSTSNPLIVTKGTTGSASNNDQIAWITPKDVFDKIKKRSDQGGLNSLSAQITIALQTRINSDLVTGTAPSSTTVPFHPVIIAGPTPYAGQVGELPITLTVGSAPIDYTKLLSNWQNQYRYAVCSNLCGYCLTVGGASCNSALLFGAEHTTAGPRPAQPTQMSDLFENDGSVTGDGKGALPLLSGGSNSFTGTTTYVSGSNDVAICVAPVSQKPVTFSCDLTNSDNASLNLSGGARLINFANGVLTLGQSLVRPLGYPSSDLFGCDWLPQVQTFGTGLRAYFNFTIVMSGRGFVFAIIDGNQYPTGTTPCGRSNQLLGYAGDNGNTSFPPINPPKIGLEIHTTNALAQGGPGYQHAAIVFWGDINSVATNDDNQHGAINSASGYPSNPTTASTGVSGNLGATGSNVLATGNTVHVRVDIVRSYDATARQGSYDIKAWLIKSPTTAQLSDLRNMTTDFTSTTFGAATTPTVFDSFTTKNLPTGALTDREALQKIRFGFTNGQGAGSVSDQVITIPTFVAMPR